MSESTPPNADPAQTPPKHRHRALRVLAWIGLSLILIVLLLALGVSWYTTTPDFQKRVGKEVVSVLEDATGGRVELGHVRFDLWHLAIEADNLVIHGTEAPGQMPYLSAARIFVRIKIHTFLSHTVGKGSPSRIGVTYLRVEQPHVHLIIDKDGKTNQPEPKHPSTSTEPVQDTLLDLQAGTVELVDGLALVNDRAIPFNLAAKDLNAEVHYIASSDRYGATVDLANLQTQIDKEPAVASKLHLTAQLGRDMFALDSLDFQTGGHSELKAKALVDHFNKPEWQASINGSLSLQQLGLLSGVDGFTGGDLLLDVNGRNCEVAPAVAQKHPHFWQRRNPKHVAPDVKLLPPSPECKSGYLLVGNVRLKGAGYRNDAVRVANVDAAAQLHVTPTELLFSALTGRLPGGGTVDGQLKVENWLGEVPSTAPATSPTTVAAADTANKAAVGVGAKPPVQSVAVTPVQRAHAYLTVTVNRLTLRTILDAAAPPRMGDLGLDTQISGPLTAEWGGPATNIASSVQVAVNLKLSPSGQHRRGAANIPVGGVLVAHYDGSTEVVDIDDVHLQTPATRLAVSGVLGVGNGDPRTNLSLDLHSSNLGEFDQTLQTLGVASNGKKGTAALPVVLHGTLDFKGTVKGPIRDIDVKGHLAADNLEAQLGTTDVHIDSIVAEAEYTPSNVAVASSTIRRGTAVLNLSGTVKPHRMVHRGAVSYAFDNDTQLNVTARLADAQVPDLLQIAGQAGKVDLTGTANLNAHVTGTLGALSGQGNLTVTNGEVYGEPYQTIALDFNAQGQQINATRVLVQAHDMQLAGSGGYNLASKRITAQLDGKNLQLSKFTDFEKLNTGADGTLTLHVDADGTLAQPNLHANIALANVVVQGKPIGQLNITAHSTGSTAFYNLRSTLVGAQVTADGQTALTGDYPTQARLTLSNVNVANAINLFSPGSVQASSDIAGTVTIAGPAAKPMQLTAQAEFHQFSVTVQGVTLQQTEPLRASLRDGVVTLQQLHITGPDTDLQASGTAQVFGDNNPQGGAVKVNAMGSVNLAIAHTFDPQLITSGKIRFNTTVTGRVKDPVLNGSVTFDDANLALDGVANGLSSLHGTMVFNQNRLEVKDLTGRSGGGNVKVGGFIAYQKGLYADLTVNLETVRVRVNGLSTTANANLRLQGGPPSLLLSGNILITRFGVGPDVDFAAFAGAGGISTPPDPNSLTAKIRLDVRVQSAPQLDFQNSYAKLAGTVDLTVRGTIAQPNVLGTIRVTDGSATFAGTTYQLDRGTIYFSNPVRIDPVVDLDVSTRVENYDITIGLHGTVENLKPTYRSSPPLTEADIFNLLALGRTQEEAQMNTQQQEQAGEDPSTSALLGGALNATVSSRVSKLFGAGSVKIDPAFVGTLGNSTARITVQEPLSKQLTLVFATNVNQSAEQLIQVQYQLNDNMSIVVTRDESGVFSIVYKIRKRYR